MGSGHLLQYCITHTAIYNYNYAFIKMLPSKCNNVTLAGSSTLSRDLAEIRKAFSVLLADPALHHRVKLALPLGLAIKLDLCRSLYRSGVRCGLCQPGSCSAPVFTIEDSSDEEDDQDYTGKPLYQLPGARGLPALPGADNLISIDKEKSGVLNSDQLQVMKDTIASFFKEYKGDKETPSWILSFQGTRQVEVTTYRTELTLGPASDSDSEEDSPMLTIDMSVQATQQLGSDDAQQSADRQVSDQPADNAVTSAAGNAAPTQQQEAALDLSGGHNAEEFVTIRIENQPQFQPGSQHRIYNAIAYTNFTHGSLDRENNKYRVNVEEYPDVADTSATRSRFETHLCFKPNSKLASFCHQKFGNQLNIFPLGDLMGKMINYIQANYLYDDKNMDLIKPDEDLGEALGDGMFHRSSLVDLLEAHTILVDNRCYLPYKRCKWNFAQENPRPVPATMETYASIATHLKGMPSKEFFDLLNNYYAAEQEMQMLDYAIHVSCLTRYIKNNIYVGPMNIVDLTGHPLARMLHVDQLHLDQIFYLTVHVLTTDGLPEQQALARKLAPLPPSPEILQTLREKRMRRRADLAMVELSETAATQMQKRMGELGRFHINLQPLQVKQGPVPRQVRVSYEHRIIGGEFSYDDCVDDRTTSFHDTDYSVPSTNERQRTNVYTLPGAQVQRAVAPAPGYSLVWMRLDSSSRPNTGHPAPVLPVNGLPGPGLAPAPHMQRAAAGGPIRAQRPTRAATPALPDVLDPPPRLAGHGGRPQPQRGAGRRGRRGAAAAPATRRRQNGDVTTHMDTAMIEE